VTDGFLPEMNAELERLARRAPGLLRRETGPAGVLPAVAETSDGGLCGESGGLNLLLTKSG
jgi:hypothetical protein